MILEEETINIIKDALTVSKQFGLTVLKIDDNGIRGTDEDGKVALLSKIDLNVGGTIGINRIEFLLNRLNILKDPTVEIKYDSTNVATSISLYNSKTLIEYRTAHASRLKVPSVPKDGDLYQISITEDLKNTLTKGKSAMKSDIITLLCNDNRLSYKIADETSDTLLYDAEFVVNMSDDEQPANFVNIYSIKELLHAFNNCEEVVGIDKRGILRFNINNLNIYLLPKT
jgi:hypothetical protein